VIFINLGELESIDWSVGRTFRIVMRVVLRVPLFMLF